MLRIQQAIVLLPMIIMISLSSQVDPSTPEITWDPVMSISRSPEKTSVDPFVLADPAGRIHIFWAEKTSDDPTNQADTLIYSVWDGNVWSNPIDIFTTTSFNPLIAYPKAILDERGVIHLIWMDQPNFPSQTVFYSSVFSDDAVSAQAWSKPLAIADNLTGTKFSFDIVYAPPDTLHLIYARVQAGESPPELRAVTYTRSNDLGKTWEMPLDLYTVQEPDHGASDTRIHTNENGLYASWTEWDATGIGQAIYFTRSSDFGNTWEPAKPITEKKSTDYERDWNNFVTLGDGTLVSVWEGGFRAYRQFMYSKDGGQSWSEPVDEFPWLIGETGSVEFVKDGSGRLYLFVSQRIREGNGNKGGGSGLWYSVWEGDTIWSEPILAGGVNPVLNPKVAIMGGNQVIATWYSTSHYEIMVLIGEIQNAEAIEKISWPRPQENQETPSLPPTPDLLPTVTTSPENQDFSQDPSSQSPQNVGLPIAYGILPVFVILLMIFLGYRKFMS